MPAVVLGYGIIFGGAVAQGVMDPEGTSAPIALFVAMAVGMLVIFVGLVPLLRLMFAPYFLVDQDMGPVDAMRAAWRVTRGRTLQIVLMTVAILVILVVGELALLVGLIPALMIQYGMLASAYRQLAGRHPAHQ